MTDYREILRKNQVKLNQLTKCTDFLIDMCVGMDLLTPIEGDDIVSAYLQGVQFTSQIFDYCLKIFNRNIPKGYKRSAEFYNSLRNDRRAFETLLDIFKESDTLQGDDVIEMLSKCLSGEDGNKTTAATVEDTGLFVLQGTPAQMETFNPGISYLKFTSIKLTHVTIERKDLIKCLLNCMNLEDLILNQISFSGDFDGQRVTLPKLQKFVLDLIPDTTMEILFTPKSLSYLDKAGFKSIMFFDKSSVQWNPEEITDLNVNIEFSVGGVKNFVVDHEECYISSSLEFSEEIVKHLQNFKLKKLALRNCEIDLSRENICLDGLKSLNLNRVAILPDLATCLQNCPDLTNLSIWRNPQMSTLQLSDLPKNLTHLTIAQIHIDYSPGIVFKHMELIYLDRCRLDDDVLEKFSGIFNSQIVSINPYVLPSCIHDSRQMHPLLKNVLDNTNTTFVRIWMRRFFNHGCEPEFYKEVENTLKSLNLGRREERFVLERRAQGWRLRETLNQRGRDQIYFHLYGGDEFWKSFNDYHNQK